MTAPSKHSNLDAALHRLSGDLDRLESYASQVEEKLEPVLGPANPKAAGASVSEAPSFSPVVSFVNSSADRARRVTDRLGDLLDRLEV